MRDSIIGRLALMRLVASAHQGHREPDTAWHGFLEALAVLCDHKCAGKTFTAIAAYQLADAVVMVIASNDRDEGHGKQHLKWLLRRLQKCFVDHIITLEELKLDLLTYSIERAHEKVEWYTQCLTRNLTEAVDEDPSCEVTGEQNLDACQTIAEREARLVGNIRRNLLDDVTPAVRCARAGLLTSPTNRAGKVLRALLKKRRESQSTHLIRHYLGRLAWIHRAVDDLLAGAASCAELFHSLKVQLVRPARPPAASAAAVASDVNLDDMLQRVGYGPATSRRKVCDIANIHNDEELEARFQQYCRQQRHNQKMHAELSVLDHFYEHGLEFLNGDRFIGGSKPACYPCAVYMECHPLHLTGQPCSGKVWPKWLYPPMRADQSETQHEHWCATRKRFMSTLERDFPRLAFDSMVRRLYHLDSTTGWGTGWQRGGMRALQSPVDHKASVRIAIRGKTPPEMW